jgi:transcription-repair coupling factor (superfamily II helicase)
VVSADRPREIIMLRAVANIVAQQPGVSAAVAELAAGGAVVIEGLAGSHRAAVLARIQEATGRPFAVVLPGGVDAEAMLLDLRAFHPAGEGRGRVVAFPELGVDPYGTLTPHPDVIRERIQTLDRCARGRADIVLAPVLSWLERLQARERFAGSTLTLTAGETRPPEELVAQLAAAGYRRTSLVESLGELAVRGGIVDVFPPTREHPVRIEYFGDEIESIREFNPRDQRSMRAIGSVVLPPARERFGLATSVVGEIDGVLGGGTTATGRGRGEGPGGASLAAYLVDPIWVEIEPEGFAEEVSAWSAHLDEHYHRALADGRDATIPEELYGELDESLQRDTPGPRLLLRELATAAGTDAEKRAPTTIRLLAQAAPSFQGRMADLSEQIAKALAAGERICLAMSRPGASQRLAEVLEEYDIPVALSVDEDQPNRRTDTSAPSGQGGAEGADRPGAGGGDQKKPSGGTQRKSHEEEVVAGKGKRTAGVPASGVFQDTTTLPPGTCWVTCADLSAGFRLPELGLWLGTDAEVFGRTRVRERRRRFHGDAFRADFRNLAPGDTVVHVEHGIGRFVAVRSLAVGGEARELMEIAYRGDDRLYLPLEQLHLVQRYQGVEGGSPKLDKLGGTAWGNVKSRVKKELREMASELLELYAARKTIPGHAFGEDTPWQREMEDAFEHEETPDQLTAIAEVKADMEAPKPMDRLLCGDVGYGKTEVAMRAAFKAVMDGKQVALLAPTTVLAHQHARTFAERLAAFPVKVELLSRFRSPAEQKEVLAGLADGSVDIVVGTHRLLSKDVQVKDLGLLVVDEEQRFGVQDKERLKRIKRRVDVLSMTATPIPRTLQMSLIGVRDLSVIESPPRDRFAVATHVMVWDPEVVAAAIRAELSRDGQAFFVHNRVESIYSIAEMLRALVPEARFRVGHGQLPERELERVMLDFVQHDADVLISTTIIENGLDIPRANTMIIHRADRFGLAQLYQLRGRIGRSDRRASAYLMIAPPDTLSDVAKKRLRAIQEFADLGSGFRLAALDLEIRGAGSLLGERQHGHMAAVGFEMYARLLEEAVHELEGEPIPAETRAQINLGVGFTIPVSYVEDPLQRLMVAKRLASARDRAQLEALREEVRDRYGALPREVEELFAYAELRLDAETLGILAADRVGRRFELRFGGKGDLDLSALVARVQQERGWSIKPPDRLVIEPVDGAGAGAREGGGGPAVSPIVALRAVFDSLPQMQGSERA